MPLLRIVCPKGTTGLVVGILLADGGDGEVSVVPGAGRPGREDLVLAEVPRPQIDSVVARIGGVAGGVRVAVEPSLRLLPTPEPAADDEAVIWSQVAHDIHGAGRLSWVNLLLLLAAAVIAAIGILADQLLLIVGAMALSPDYYLIADVCLGLSRRAWAAGGRAVLTLVAGFAGVVAGAWLLAEVLTRTGVIEPAGSGSRGLTLFIADPGVLSVLVALVAGVAGALAITLPGARGLVGVFVSVTTIPAAANIGVALAARDSSELAGASGQLLVNVSSLLAAGTVTLALRHRGRAPRQLPKPLPHGFVQKPPHW